MKIACNYSSTLMRLLGDARIDVDYIKNGDFGCFREVFSEMRRMRPVLLHGLGYFEYTGMRDMSVIDFDRAEWLIKECGSPHFGAHMSISNVDMHEGMTEEEIHSRMSAFVRVFKRRLPVPLLLENSVDTPGERITYDRYPYLLPEQMNRLLAENDISLLLDLTHARITAEANGWEARGFIKEFSLERLKEIHICGSGYDEKGLPEDKHQAMADVDYAMLEWVLSFAKPDIVTLEYNGVEGETEEEIETNLVTQLGRIRKICGL